MSGKPMLRFVLGGRQAGKTEAARKLASPAKSNPVACPARHDVCARGCGHGSQCKDRISA